MSIHQLVAVDPVTIVIKECINLSTAIRKYSKYASQNGVAALLSGSSEIFSNQDPSLAITFNSLSTNRNNDPFLSAFIQLRLMLNKLNNLDDIDSLTVLQPFLIVISSSSISGYITFLALDALEKFFNLNIINENSKNYVGAYRETVDALTHCRFEGSKQTSDDSILLKVVMILNSIINSPYGDILSDSIMYDVVQTIMSLACNKRRTEVLRKAAESTMISITIRIFGKLGELESDSTVLPDGKYINDESYSKNKLKDDTMGTNVFESTSVESFASTANEGNSLPRNDGGNEQEEEQNGDGDGDVIKTVTKVTEVTEEDDKSSREEEQEISTVAVKPARGSNMLDPNYGILVAKQFLDLLLYIISPENQTKHINSTRIFGLQLINTAVELSGDKFTLHPRLFNLLSDPIFKCVLHIIQNTPRLSLLQAALQLFTTLVVILGNYLPMQIELTLTRIFAMLAEDVPEKSSKTASGIKNHISTYRYIDGLKPGPVKELLIEQLSILWTRSPSFFTSTFINYDCNLDRADVALEFLRALCKLSLPESALNTTESVPPICLEGLVALIDDMYTHIQDAAPGGFSAQLSQNNEVLKQRERKTEFIKCSKIFNEKPKKGIPLLVEKGFIKSESNEDVAGFLFTNNNLMNKKTIGLLLCDPDRTDLLNSFITLFDFKGLRVDEAIRVLLTKFRLPGESQQIERIVEAFSSQYVKCQNYNTAVKETSDGSTTGVLETGNPEEEDTPVQPDADSVFVLSYSIIMLNTDLHNPQVKEHMSFEDYSGNLKGCYNGMDFPQWYLDRIYRSIRDKEIVMPEEHHGNEKWFEDAWNNLISSTMVMTEVQNDSKSIINSMTPSELLCFDRAIFKSSGSTIVNTFFKIYLVASDDHITSRMLTSLSKCAFIAGFYNFKKLYNDILSSIARVTTLLGPSVDKNSTTETEDGADVNPDRTMDDIYVDLDSIPLVEITFEESGKKIAVSDQAVKLGSSFKAQLCTIIFFRILKETRNPELITPILWKKTIKMMLTLFENLLLPGDIFPDLQRRLKLNNLPKPAADIYLTKSRESKGLLSTFASYLKGDEEPSDEEITASIKAFDCIQTTNIPSAIFGNEAIMTPSMVKAIIGSIKVKKNEENSKYFEAEFLFLVEVSVALFLLCKNNEEVGIALADKVAELQNLTGITKGSVRRLLAYKLLLLSVLQGQEERLGSLINDELLAKSEIFSKKYFVTEQGKGLINGLLELTNIPNYSAYVLGHEGFWKLLRFFASMPENAQVIYDYLREKLGHHNGLITESNFMLILGLLDEISSLGAIGSNWEEEYRKSVKSGHKINNDNPYQPIVELSLKSIDLTSSLLQDSSLSRTEITAVIQTIAHQCENPCEQIRKYASSTLESALTENLVLPISGITTIEELLDGGLLSLLKTENERIQETGYQGSMVSLTTSILSVVSKVYLFHFARGNTTNETYLNVLNIFNTYVEMPEIEKLLQDMIIEKKNLEKRGAHSGSQSPSPVPTSTHPTNE